MSNTYIVQPGDTLPTIAAHLGLDLESLQDATPELHVGQEVRFIGEYRPSNCIIYTIKDGDTLDSIADDYGVDAAHLMDRNPEISDPDQLEQGEVLRIDVNE